LIKIGKRADRPAALAGRPAVSLSAMVGGPAFDVDCFPVSFIAKLRAGGAGRGVNDELFDRLTERQRECLRLIYTHHSIKEIARLLGLTEDGIKWHLREARETLGVGRSAEAARLVFGDALPQTYLPRVGAPGVVSSAEPAAMIGSSPDMAGKRTQDDALREPQARYRIEPILDEGPGLRLPLPTAGRPRNDLTAIEKLAWGLAIGILAALLLGALTSLQHIIS